MAITDVREVRSKRSKSERCAPEWRVGDKVTHVNKEAVKTRRQLKKMLRAHDGVVSIGLARFHEDLDLSDHESKDDTKYIPPEATDDEADSREGSFSRGQNNLENQ